MHIFVNFVQITKSRKQTGTSKTNDKYKITSLEDPVLIEKEKQELIACIMRAWHDIAKHNVPREIVVSADQLLAEEELRDGVTYCRRGEGSTMSSGWYKSGATFTLYSGGFGDGNVEWVSATIKPKDGKCGPLITKRFSEYFCNNDILIIVCLLYGINLGVYIHDVNQCRDHCFGCNDWRADKKNNSLIVMIFFVFIFIFNCVLFFFILRFAFFWS